MSHHQVSFLAAQLNAARQGLGTAPAPTDSSDPMAALEGGVKPAFVAATMRTGVAVADAPEAAAAVNADEIEIDDDEF